MMSDIFRAVFHCAGPAGFEPSIKESKSFALTAWRRPITTTIVPYRTPYVKTHTTEVACFHCRFRRRTE